MAAACHGKPSVVLDHRRRTRRASATLAIPHRLQSVNRGIVLRQLRRSLGRSGGTRSLQTVVRGREDQTRSSQARTLRQRTDAGRWHHPVNCRSQRRCLLSQRIIIQVSTTGETVVRTEGFSGSSCQKASQFIEQALGSRQSEQLTQDFYSSSTDAGTHTINQGESQ